jgi:RimJ/RimL family protein N-acetyltransferase
MKAFFLGENTAARAIAETLGMHHEFTFHEQIFSGFAWHDQPVYVIFDREWLTSDQVTDQSSSTEEESDSQ